jgi:ankyrin repeat protein
MNEYLLDYAEIGDSDSIATLLIPTMEYYLNIDTKYYILYELRGLDDFTALHIASNEGDIKMIDLLLKHAANIECLTKFNRTPLFLAVM